jgi:pimeloyl-ACP methyl ester carboxylesterase
MRWSAAQTPDGAWVRAGVLRGRPGAPTVLLMHGFAQNHRCFATPGRDFSAWLNARGYTVVLGELRGRFKRAARPTHRFHHHVEVDAPKLLQLAHEMGQGGPLILGGHSMGALVAAAVEPAEALGVVARVLLCPPYAFAPQLGVLRPVGRSVLSRLNGVGLPTHTLGRVFASLHPVLDRAWAPEAMAVWAPGQAAAEQMRWVMRHSFVRESPGVLADLLEWGDTHDRAGSVRLGERLRALEGPVMVVGGGKDGLALASGVRALWHVLRPHPQSALAEFPAHGHVDILVGHQAPHALWPRVQAFVKRVAGPAGRGDQGA